MLAKALFILAAAFAVLTLARIAAARRALWLKRGPPLILGAVAMYLLLRGNWMFAVGFAGLAAAFWFYAERAPEARARPQAGSGPMSAIEARAILGVSPAATAAEISAAYRAKMSRAHPDRGGSHELAARINAARETLLKN